MTIYTLFQTKQCLLSKWNLNLCSWILHSTKQTEEEVEKNTKSEQLFYYYLKIEIPFIATIKLQITAEMIRYFDGNKKKKKRTKHGMFV